jgi:hypothetical protein
MRSFADSAGAAVSGLATTGGGFVPEAGPGAGFVTVTAGVDVVGAPDVVCAGGDDETGCCAAAEFDPCDWVTGALGLAAPRVPAVLPGTFLSVVALEFDAPATDDEVSEF